MKTILGKAVHRIRYSLLMKSILHEIAMHSPYMKNTLYRMRGSTIDSTAQISDYVFLEKARPDLITIESGVHIGPRAMLITHDSSKKPTSHGAIVLEKNCFIGAGAIIKQGVVVGEGAVIGLGAVVTKNVPPGEVWGSPPARRIK